MWDNIFAYKPLPFMKKLYYLNVDLYRYYIGREDQSVSAKNIVRRYDQQIRVMKEMIGAYTYEQLEGLESGLCGYMKHYLSVVMMLTMIVHHGRQGRYSRAQGGACGTVGLRARAGRADVCLSAPQLSRPRQLAAFPPARQGDGGRVSLLQQKDQVQLKTGTMSPLIK